MNESKLRPVVQTIIEDPEVAKSIVDWQTRKITKEEQEKIKEQDKLFEGMYIQKL